MALAALFSSTPPGSIFHPLSLFSVGLSSHNFNIFLAELNLFNYFL